jgi:hypothetical protein
VRYSLRNSLLDELAINPLTPPTLDNLFSPPKLFSAMEPEDLFSLIGDALCPS